MKLHCRDFYHQIIFPCRELSNFVSHFWLSRWYAGIQNSFSYHSTASTNSEIVFAFAPGDGKKKKPVFSSAQGHTRNYCRIETGGISEMFGVSIYSHAIPFFFEVSVSQLADQLVDLSQINKNADAIIDQLGSTDSFSERVGIMTQYLKTNFNGSRKTDMAMMNAIRRMRTVCGNVKISAMAHDVSLSQKQFERRFKEFSGFNPKLYARILRFESSLDADKDDATIAEVALDLGYYDQAHFTNDYRKFSGFSPGKYTPITNQV